jgi:prevent-host-death family protein
LVNQSNTAVRTVPLYEAKTRLSALLDAVAAGEEITITRNGHPAALLVPVPSRAEKVAAAVARIRSIRKGVRLPEGVTVRDLIDEGRRY